MKLLKRSEINTEKWDACVTRSTKPLIYGLSWYLDAACKNWSGLVWGDYEAVLPLPWNKKLIKKQIYVPHATQQLGPFGNLSIIDNKSLIDFLRRRFLRVMLSTSYSFGIAETTHKSNQILALDKPYDELKREYRKDRIYRLNQIQKQGCHKNAELTIEKFLTFYLHHTTKMVKELQLDIDGLTSVVKTAYELKQCRFYGAEVSGELSSVICLLQFQNRITQFLLISNPLGYEKNSSTFLIDQVIQRFAGSDFIYDFEGSSQAGIRSFFKSFGSIEEPYFLTSFRNI